MSIYKHINKKRVLTYLKTAKENYVVGCQKRSNWESVVGLEIHAQINTESKLFSGSSTCFGRPVNSNVSLFDAAIPGTLPVLNEKCVQSGLLTALALSCKINPVSFFDRKHYFYADLPAGYQITQQRAPLAQGGEVIFHVFTPGIHRMPYKKTSKLKQLQLEQDSGKSLHDESEKRSLIDLNRAGIPLMELVFEPDLSDGEEAAALVKELALIFERINTCTCKMEEGALRVDANVSVNPPGERLGTRTEIKNIGSVRGVANAINFEIERQIDVLENGGEIFNETRSWDAVNSVTVPMRDKEVKQDYRFMPEPNLPPLKLNLSEEFLPGQLSINKIKNKLPELPEETRKVLQEKFGLNNEFVFTLTSNMKILKLFREIMEDNPERKPKIVAVVLAVEYMNFINKGSLSYDDGKLDRFTFGQIVDLIQSGQINLVTARKVLQEISEGNRKRPKQIVLGLGLLQITDEKELEKICKCALDENPSIVAQYKRGKIKVFPAIVGHVAKKTNNRAHMGIVTKMLKDMLKM